jgi:hypothetical protein
MHIGDPDTADLQGPQALDLAHGLYAPQSEIAGMVARQCFEVVERT